MVSSVRQAMRLGYDIRSDTGARYARKQEHREPSLAEKFPGKKTRRGGRRRDGIRLFHIAGAVSPQFKLETGESLRHGPAMIGFECGPEEESQVSDDGIDRANFPVKADIGEFANGNNGPNATADQISGGLGSEKIRGFADCRARVPMQGIGKSAASVQVNGTGASCGGHLKINQRPPARILERLAEDIEDILRRSFHPPAGDEVVLMRHGR